MALGTLVQHSLAFGLLLAALQSVVVLGSLWINSEIGWRTYPPAVKAAFGPMSEKARRQRILPGLLFIGLALGTVVLFLVTLRSRYGAPLAFGEVFLGTVILLNVLNLVDLLVLDWLIFAALRPAFIMLPGTEGMAEYADLGFYFSGFVKGVLISVFVSLITAGIVLIGGINVTTLLCRQTSAVLIIDVQAALFERSRPIYNAAGLLANLSTVLDRAHAAGALAVFFQHSNKTVLKENSTGWELALSPGPSDLIMRKKHGSAFRETPLHQELQSRHIATLIIGGLTTHGCVRATCKDALALGYQVVLLEDGHSSTHADAARLIEEWNQKLSSAGADVQPCGAIRFS